MTESYVNRVEFDALKEEVKEIKKGMKDTEKLLQEIDKKVSAIVAELSNANKIEELKIQPIHERLKKVEDNQSWLWRLVVGAVIAAGLALII